VSLKEDDIELLLPSFRPYVRVLRAVMVRLGYRPCVRETYRTPAQAAANAVKGTGSAKSIHCYGAAADFVCQDHHWDCAKHGCRFFHELGIQAELLGLTWGGRWTRGGRGPDMPHVQAIAVKDQARFRALRPEQRDAFVRARLRPLPDVTR
jgi:hypothetical protein